ncbi:MAG: NAD(P)H-hydrate epimerase [Chroococcidiopsis cubana SAG 39.79]|nr:NAD(P)H-hydrate epimerase [Chroococcidiopsis cubana]MDZ4874465.1 NAD(P)H-hydrate epimerase [Chroococcidiopsis cubana SAG 39.79]
MLRVWAFHILRRSPPLQDCDLLIDGLFGFGMERQITEPIASDIHQLDRWSMPILSIDLPSGLHTDTGEALGKAVKATRTFVWDCGSKDYYKIEH